MTPSPCHLCAVTKREHEIAGGLKVIKMFRDVAVKSATGAGLDPKDNALFKLAAMFESALLVQQASVEERRKAQMV